MSYRHTSLARSWPILATALVLLSLAACAKKAGTADAVGPKPASVELVPVAEQSRHFETVNSHLELGGTLYGYVDIDGDLLDLAGNVQSVVKQVATLQPQLSMFAKQDFKALMTDLGLTDVKAIGFSSVREASGLYRNRAFLYTPEGRHGLFAVFGGQPGKFVGARLAPKGTDFFAEHEFDIVAVYQTVKEMIAKVNGPDAAAAFEKAVKEAGAGAHFSVLDLLQGLNGRATFILRLDPEKNVSLPGPKPVKIPAFSILIRVDGIGPAVESALTNQNSQFAATQEGSLHLYTNKTPAPLEGVKLVIAVDGKALYAATSPDFLHECLKRTDGLDTNPEFVSALANLGPDGNGLTWATPRFFSRIKGLPEVNQDVAPQVKKLLDMYAANIPAVSQPLLSVRTNLPEGILIRSTWNRSLKADVAMLTVYNPVTVGLLAAMAIPAFERVRTDSQAKAVTNNLRMLSAAADQFYLEKGVTTATYDDLVGPDKFVKAVVPVAGEDYHQLVFSQGRRLHVALPDGRTFDYPSDTSQSGNPRNALGAGVSADDARKRMGVRRNRYYEVKGVTSTTFGDVMSEPAHPDITPVMGEDYRSVVLEKGVPVQIKLPDGRVVRAPVSRPQPLLGKPAGPNPVAPANPVPAPAAQKASPSDAAIMENLRKLDDAANAYYDANGVTSVTLDQLVGPRNAIPELIPVAGESYQSVLFKKGHPLRLFLKDGRTLVYPPPGPDNP
jgi:type IV pilus assembly protein PilA